MKEIFSRFSSCTLFLDEDFDWFVASGKTINCAPNTILIKEASAPESLYFLLEGLVSVAIFPESSTAAGQEVAQLGTGEMIGEMSFVDNHPASATVRTLSEVQTLAIDRETLNRKLLQDQGFAARFYQTVSALVSRRLRNLEGLLAHVRAVASPRLRKVLFVFNVLNDRDIEWMIQSGLREKYPPGTVLINQGDPDLGVYVLIDGNISVSIAVEEGGVAVNKEIARLASGEILGEMAFVETSNASATVTAVDSALALWVPTITLQKKLREDQGFASRFYHAIACVLTDRVRSLLKERGYGSFAYSAGQSLDEETEYGDEIDIDVLEQTAIAGTRFDWMVQRVRQIRAVEPL